MHLARLTRLLWRCLEQSSLKEMMDEMYASLKDEQLGQPVSSENGAQQTESGGKVSDYFEAR